MTIELDEQERALLIEVLDSYLSDLRMEIADTDRMAYREQLKQRKQILLDIQKKLGATTGGETIH